MKTINEAKQYILSEIYPKLLSFKKQGGPSPKLKNEFFEIINKFRPELLEQYKNSKKICIKTHLIYCFLNDLNITPATRYFKIDNNLKRIIIDDLTLKEFAIKCNTKAPSLMSKIVDYGFDLKYPRMIYYSNSYIKNIIKRLKVKTRKCVACGESFHIKHKKQKCCGIKCQSILSSERMKIKNPSQIYEISKETRKKLSNSTIKNIKSGKFTPCVTNSWANSKVFLKMFNMNFRSTWEAYFYIFMKAHNKNVQYEKTRIKYYDSALQKYRNYITDFTDFDNKIIYEIKPKALKESQNVKDKEKFALNWCKDNNYEFIFVCNDWFKENFDNMYLFNIEEPHKEKILKGMKQFEN